MNNKIGRFGILTCNLIDPLYILISKISISYDNSYNSLGFYYINDDGDYNITLFDLYDSYHIKWTVSYTIMSYFTSSSHVEKIDFYSLDDDSKFITLHNILKCNERHTRSKLEEKFINIISGLLLSYNYERNYTNLLLNIVNNKKLGEDLINKVLLLLNNHDIIDHFSKYVKHILSFKKNVNYINIIDDNFDNVINCEILKLKDSFLKIYTNHKILLNVDLSIFSEECDKKLITDNEIIIKKIDMKNLGYWLNQITCSNNKLEQNYYLKNVITIYNNIIHNINIDKIDVNKNIDLILNPDLISDRSSSEEIISIIQSNINTQNKTDLSVLSYNQLFDILIYIDSLRDSSGITDNRFSGVQNLITKELSYRTKTKNLG
jgi:hypothetical protein